MSRVCLTCCQPASSCPNKQLSAVCEFCTHAHLSQPTAHPSVNTSLCYRWYSRAGFVMWHRQKRWPLLCLQGRSAAHAKLGQLLASHTALTALRSPPTAKIDSNGDGFLSPSQPAQEKQDLTACKEDIVSLIQAMFSRCFVLCKQLVLQVSMTQAWCQLWPPLLCKWLMPCSRSYQLTLTGC